MDRKFPPGWGGERMTLGDIARDYWPSALVFALFGLGHSLGAQDGVKDWLARHAGRFVVEHFWRLAYCVASWVLLYELIGALHWGRHPGGDYWVIDYPEWLWRAIVVLHLLSIALVYAAFVHSDYLEFWGLRQAWRGIARARARVPAGAPLRRFGTERLEVGGVYRWMRHPMLSGGLVFLATSGPSRNNLVFTALYLAYMLIGGYFEERRLVRVFGDAYRDYRREVGAFWPRPRQLAAALRSARRRPGRGP